MYDFCLTLPYGALLALGGFIGMVFSDSVTSGLTSGASGLALLVVGSASYQEFFKRKESPESEMKSHSYAYIVLSFIITLMVTFITGHKNIQAGVAPGDSTFYGSALMLAFYSYKLVFSSSPAPVRKED